jgi:hypothetical protein
MTDLKKQKTSILPTTKATTGEKAAQKCEPSAQLKPSQRLNQDEPIQEKVGYSLRSHTRRDKCSPSLSSSTTTSTTTKPRERIPKPTTSEVKQARVQKRKSNSPPKKPAAVKKVNSPKARTKAWSPEEIEILRTLVTDGYLIFKSALEEKIMNGTTVYVRISARMEDNGFTRTGEACRKRWDKLQTTPRCTLAREPHREENKNVNR